MARNNENSVSGCWYQHAGYQLGKNIEHSTVRPKRFFTRDPTRVRRNIARSRADHSTCAIYIEPRCSSRVCVRTSLPRAFQVTHRTHRVTCVTRVGPGPERARACPGPIFCPDPQLRPSPVIMRLRWRQPLGSMGTSIASCKGHCVHWWLFHAPPAAPGKPSRRHVRRP